MIVYRDVKPVVGEAVPEGCMWDWGYGEWFPVTRKVWAFSDCWGYALGVQYVLEAGYIAPNWLNTLSLD